MEPKELDLPQLLRTAHDNFEKACKVALAKDFDLSDQEMLLLLRTAHDSVKKARKVALVIWTKSYQHALFRACRASFDCDTATAKDIVQKTLIKAVCSVGGDTWPEIRSISGWLFIIAKNLARDTKRKATRDRRRDRQYAESAPRSARSPEDAIAPEELTIQRLNRLKYAEKEILVLRIILELSYPEIMDTLGISYVAVRARFSRASKKLQAGER